MSNEPRITFPCPYPLKIIGDTAPAMAAEVVDIVRQHASELEESSIEVLDSRNGNFCSVRITIIATGEDQLRGLHADLLAHPAVRLVL
jgi:putative lipoic acid-binding regulatory protein